MGCTVSQSDETEADPLAIHNDVENLRFEQRLATINGDERNVVSWTPLPADEPGHLVPVKAVVFICHGLLEHSLCYYPIAVPLARDGYAVFSIDHVAHGKSKGKRGIVPSHDCLYKDFVSFCNGQMEKDEFKGLPAFVLGHSMGGLISAVAIPLITGLTAAVFSGTALVPGPASASPFGIKALYPITKTSLAMKVIVVTSTLDPGGSAAPLSGADVIWDEVQIALRAKDQCRCKPFIPNKTAYSVLQLNKMARDSLPSINLPFLAIHGSEDIVCMPEGSELLLKNTGTNGDQKRLAILEGFKHEAIQESSPMNDAPILMIREYFEIQYRAVCTVPEGGWPDLSLLRPSPSSEEGREGEGVTSVDSTTVSVSP